MPDAMTRPTQPELAARFRALHQPGRPLLMPNPWDAGSARLLVSLGFDALATTSSGFASTRGRLDGSIGREESLRHASEVVAVSDVPVSADLENGFGVSPEEVAATAAGALAAGLAGFSIEDSSGDEHQPIFELALAAERIAAAAELAHGGPARMVVTARAENYLHDRADLDDTITRLRAYQEAGADVLYAPGIRSAQDIQRLVESVDRPVNVLALLGVPSVSELAALGVSRISVGGAFAFAAIGAVVEATRELTEHGTYGFSERAAAGVRAARQAFS